MHDKQHLQTAVLMVLLAVVLGVAGWLLATSLHLENLHRIAELVAGRGVLGPLVMIALHVIGALTGVLPTSPLTIISGAIWGPWTGTLISVIGLQTGAVLSFLVARSALFPWVDKYFASHVRLYRRIDDRYITRFVFVTRLFPFFIFELISYGAGLTRISFKHYFWATLLGMTPWVFILSATGRRLAATSGPFVWMITLAALTLMLAAPWVVERYDPWNLKRRLLNE